MVFLPDNILPVFIEGNFESHFMFVPMNHQDDPLLGSCQTKYKRAGGDRAIQFL